MKHIFLTMESAEVGSVFFFMAFPLPAFSHLYTVSPCILSGLTEFHIVFKQVVCHKQHNNRALYISSLNSDEG